MPVRPCDGKENPRIDAVMTDHGFDPGIFCFVIHLFFIDFFPCCVLKISDSNFKASEARTHGFQGECHGVFRSPIAGSRISPSEVRVEATAVGLKFLDIYTPPSMGFVFFLRMNPRGTGSLSEIRTTHFMLVAV